MASSKTPELNVSLDRARAFWHSKQGLAEPPSDDPAEVISRTGWARTLGGVDVYFAVRARCPGLRRQALDDAVAHGAVRVVPAVRGCIYLVAEHDVPLVMALAADLSRPRTERDLDKTGSSWDEVESVAAEVSKVLADGPRTTAGIRKALPAGAVRSLGAAGKKAGISSPLPVALRELEFRGAIERMPVGARLDTEHYEWRAVETPLSEKYPVPGDKAARRAAVTRRFLEFFGPATLKEIATWVGVPQRDAKAALAELPVVETAVEGLSRSAWVLADDKEALAGASPSSDSFSFLAFEDNYLTVHGGPGILADPAHHDIPIESWGSSKATTLGQARHVATRALLVGERIAGFWEVDLDADEVVVGTLADLPRHHARALQKEREQLGAFVRDELGHARSFSLDTDKAVRGRAADVRRMS